MRRSGSGHSYPLIISGLALAGANNAINSAESDSPDDGILTALEVSGLNLNGTKLVTLSACETGVGEYMEGEGVFSLRRAFHHAGAESVLMSLWTVPDQQTTEIMATFYENWIGGQPKRRALRNSVLHLLEKQRRSSGHGHPYFWGGFVLVGNYR